MRKFLILLFFTQFINTLSAQTEKEYWFVAPDISYLHGGAQNSDRPVYFMITAGAEPATVTISMPANAGFADITKLIPANDSWKFEINSLDPNFPNNSVLTVENPSPSPIAGTVTNKGIHIHSNNYISAYYQVDGHVAKDLFALKGESALGTEFYTPFQSVYPRIAWYSDAFAQIHIVATQNNTKVKICPTETIALGTGTLLAGDTGTFILNKGETFLARPLSHTGNLPGTYIKSDKPIAVTVADDALTTGKIDICGDQLVPIDGLGTNYVIIKGYTENPVTDNLYILGTKDSTGIQINTGSTIIIDTVHAGETFHMDMGHITSGNKALYVTTSKPSYCYHQSGIGGEIGAAILPSMYSISSRRIVFNMKKEIRNNVFLIFRSDVSDAFTINGNPIVIDAVNSESVPGLPSWRYIKYDVGTVPEGTCVIRNTAGAFAMGYFYGNTSNTSSYGFLSNFGTFRFDQDTVYKCPGSTYKLDGGYAKSYQWWEQEGNILSYDSVFEVTTPGWYKVTVDQDPYVIVDSICVLDRYFGSVKVKSKGNNPQTFWVEEPGMNTSKSYVWTWSAGTSTSDTLNITWPENALRLLSVKITDDELGCDTTFNVQYAANDSIKLFACGDSLIDVLANDGIHSDSILSIVTPPNYGTATIVGDQIKYENTGGSSDCKNLINKTDTIVYRVCTSSGDCAEALVYIKIIRNPEIILKNKCSYQPSLALEFQYSGASYKWLYSNDDGATWTTEGTTTIPELNTSKEGIFKVEITQNGNTHTSDAIKITLIDKSIMTTGAIWYNMEGVTVKL